MTDKILDYLHEVFNSMVEGATDDLKKLRCIDPEEAFKETIELVEAVDQPNIFQQLLETERVVRHIEGKVQA